MRKATVFTDLTICGGRSESANSNASLVAERPTDSPPVHERVLVYVAARPNLDGSSVSAGDLLACLFSDAMGRPCPVPKEAGKGSLKSSAYVILCQRIKLALYTRKNASNSFFNLRKAVIHPTSHGLHGSTCTIEGSARFTEALMDDANCVLSRRSSNTRSKDATRGSWPYY